MPASTSAAVPPSPLVGAVLLFALAASTFGGFLAWEIRHAESGRPAVESSLQKAVSAGRNSAGEDGEIEKAAGRAPPLVEAGPAFTGIAAPAKAKRGMPAQGAEVSIASPPDSPQKSAPSAAEPAIEAVPGSAAAAGRSLAWQASASLALPALAPAHVILNIRGGGAGGPQRVEAVQNALHEAGIMAGEVSVKDSASPAAAVSYYFRPDRETALAISRKLKPLIGDSLPVALRHSSGFPQPGTIEIALP